MDKYTQLVKTAQDMGEKNDCTVKALSISTGVDYATCRDVLANLGRKTGKGIVFFYFIDKAMKALGFKAKELPSLRQPNGFRYTPKTIGERLPTGSYICLVKGHVFPLVNGIVEDWTANKKHRIITIWEVTKQEEKSQ